MSTARLRIPLLACCFLLGLGLAGAAPKQVPKAAEHRKPLLAEDGVPYDSEESQRLMGIKPLSPNLLRNGSFEAGHYWPAGWEATDQLATFWAAGGTAGQRCIRINTNVLDSQWKTHRERLEAALERTTARSRTPLQALPEDPRPPAPKRLPTRPPYYDTVAGLHGVHYRSDYVPVEPGAVYRFSIDARCSPRDQNSDADANEPASGVGEPKVFIKGFVDLRMHTSEGVRKIRRDAYRAPLTLDPCDTRWRRYVRQFSPWESKTTMDGKPLKPQFLQVQIYAYWRPGDYYFDNARLEIIARRDVARPAAKPKATEPESEEPPAPTRDGFPVFGH